MSVFIRSEHQQRVDEFMRLANQELPETPVMPGEAVRKLRANIILEEALETIEGLGFRIRKPYDGFEFELEALTCGPDLVLAVDGCADLRVVTTGTLSALGVADLAVQEEVDKNNLAKFGPGGYRREDGKWMKPPGHQPPDILGVLEKMGYKR
jgi:predicted HAD superfamily Cof-like phosphohydrolase